MPQDEIKQTVWTAIREISRAPWEKVADLALLRDDLGFTAETLGDLRILLCDLTGAGIPPTAMRGCHTVSDVVYLTEAAEAQAVREMKAVTAYMRAMMEADVLR